MLCLAAGVCVKRESMFGRFFNVCDANQKEAHHTPGTSSFAAELYDFVVHCCLLDAFSLVFECWSTGWRVFFLLFFSMSDIVVFVVTLFLFTRCSSCPFSGV